MADEGPTFRTLISAFGDFLTVAIHIILYERLIYPRTSFLQARKYNLPVWQNRHPKVCEWINDAVSHVEAQLLKSTVERVVVVIYETANRPLERYIFDTSRFPVMAEKDAGMPLQRKGPNGEKVDVLPTIDLEEQYRATLSRLSNSSTKLKPTPPGCTFTVAIELRNEGEPPIGHPQAWIPVQPVNENGANNGQQSKESLTIPVRAIAAGDMMLEMWIEEAKHTQAEPTSSGDTVSTSYG